MKGDFVWAQDVEVGDSLMQIVGNGNYFTLPKWNTPLSKVRRTSVGLEVTEN